MSQRGPWSVKGIDTRAREVAREAAREEGMTLGAYLNRLILEDDSPEAQARVKTPPQTEAREHAQTAAHAPIHGLDTPSPASATALDRLTRRIESAEARSTLAITGIDQSVVGLLSRLENAEHNQQAMGGHFEGVMDDIQKTYDTLNVKVAALEADDSTQSNLTALKALEDALGKLASYVYEENELVGTETSAIKVRLESGLGEITDRMDDIDSTIHSKLDDVTANFHKTIAEAELRTEGISKHLAERFSSVEVEVSEKLSHVQEMSLAMDQVNDNVESAMSNMGDTLGHMQERLSRAETLTDKAMRELEDRFSALDTRLEEIQRAVTEVSEQKFDARFESLSSDLRELVTNTRIELAGEIEAAAKSVDADVLDRIDGAIASIGTRLDTNESMQTQTMDMVGETVARVTESVDQRLTANQDQQARAIEVVSQQVSRISEGLDKRITTLASTDAKTETDALREEMIRFTNTLDDRLEYLESREDETFEKISGEVGKLADRLDERVVESEKRSAEAIEQVGEQVAGVARRIEKRQHAALKAFADKLDETQKRQDARLTGALSSVSERLERMQEQSITSMSPVQKAIGALAQRIEAIEDFSAPPYAAREESTPIPAMVAPVKIDTDLTPDVEAVDTPAPSTEQAGESLHGFLDPIFEEPEGDIFEEPESNIEAQKDFQSIAADMEADLAPPKISDDADEFEPGIQSWADDANAVLDDTLSVQNNATDDLIIHDGLDETRDSDIFADEDNIPPMPDMEEFVKDEFETVAAAPPGALEQNARAETGKEDYLSRARSAAKNAATKPDSSPFGSTKESGGISNGTKALGVAALAAAAVVGGVLYTRGDTKAPSLEFGESAGEIETAQAAEGAGPTGGDTVDASATLASLPVDADEIENGLDTDVSDDSQLTETATTLASTDVEEPQLIPDPVEVASTVPTVDRAKILATPLIAKTVSVSTAANEGNRFAQYKMGNNELQSGRFQSGAQWLEKSAKQGLPIAQYDLAVLHENGTGTTRDPAQARYWHKAAARGGNVEAMFDFASYNANGHGGEANLLVAAEWFRKAAEFGHADSQYNLAQLYLQGNGVSPSYEEALYWFGLAALSGDTGAEQAAQEILSQGFVSPEAARSVRVRIREWRKATPNPAANGKFGSSAWNTAGAGNRVLSVQKVLSALGYDVGTPDGVAGGQTRTAIKAFERSAGMPETGQITTRLVDVLNATLKTEKKAA